MHHHAVHHRLLTLLRCLDRQCYQQFALNTEVEDSDSQETQCDELRQLVDAQLQAKTLTVAAKDREMYVAVRVRADLTQDDQYHQELVMS